MKLKKIIASTMALLCFSSANMITYAVETDIEDDVYVVKSGIVTPLIPEDIALSTQIQIIPVSYTHLDVYKRQYIIIIFLHSIHANFEKKT